MFSISKKTIWAFIVCAGVLFIAGAVYASDKAQIAARYQGISEDTTARAESVLLKERKDIAEARQFGNLVPSDASYVISLPQSGTAAIVVSPSAAGVNEAQEESLVYLDPGSNTGTDDGTADTNNVGIEQDESGHGGINVDGLGGGAAIEVLGITQVPGGGGGASDGGNNLGGGGPIRLGM